MGKYEQRYSLLESFNLYKCTRLKKILGHVYLTQLSASTQHTNSTTFLHDLQYNTQCTLPQFE